MDTMSSTLLGILLAVGVVALVIGATYLERTSVEVEPFKSNQFVAKGVYDTSTNKLAGNIKNISNQTYGYVEV